MATRVWESAVIDAPIDEVWKLVRPLTFSYNSYVTSASNEGKSHDDEVGAIKAITYKDGTTQRIMLIGLSDASWSVSWDVIESEPPIEVYSVSHTIRLRRVTESNQTFATWTTDFSNDATATVTEDQRYKQRENFTALQKAVASLKGKKASSGQDTKETKTKHLVGAPTDAKKIDDETAKFVLSLKSDVEHLAGYSFEEFVPVAYKTQVVSGINYFVKIKTGDNYIHVTIWKRVGGLPPQVTNVYPGKTASDPL